VRLFNLARAHQAKSTLSKADEHDGIRTTTVRVAMKETSKNDWVAGEFQSS
jgi:hypothetical protein